MTGNISATLNRRRNWHDTKTKTKRKTSKARNRSTRRAQPLLGRADYVRKGKKALAVKKALAAKQVLAAEKALADKIALTHQSAVDEKAAANERVLADKMAIAERSTTAPLAATARLTASYMALPIRLAACRSPFDLWREQARVAHQSLMLMQSVAFGRH
jgi:hypothetical protein